jgi:hypothetical protein
MGDEYEVEAVRFDPFRAILGIEKMQWAVCRASFLRNYDMRMRGTGQGVSRQLRTRPCMSRVNGKGSREQQINLVNTNGLS